MDDYYPLCTCWQCLEDRDMDMNVTTHEAGPDIILDVLGKEIISVMKHKELSLLTMADLLTNLAKELRDKHEEVFEG